jgi:hypothetical protein
VEAIRSAEAAVAWLRNSVASLLVLPSSADMGKLYHYENFRAISGREIIPSQLALDMLTCYRNGDSFKQAHMAHRQPPLPKQIPTAR